MDKIILWIYNKIILREPVRQRLGMTPPGEFESESQNNLLVYLYRNFFLNHKKQILIGDLDRDGQITQRDVDIAMDIAVGKIVPTPYQLFTGDLNKDGRINSADVALIQRMLDASTTG